MMQKFYYKIGIIATIVVLIYMVDLIGSNYKTIVSFVFPNRPTKTVTADKSKGDGLTRQIKETTSMIFNNEPFWVNSGGIFYLQDEIGHSIIGDLPQYSPWRFTYLATNPADTDNGFHPQNILRLITKEKTKNFSAQSYFLIANDNLSNSPNRNESNGIFLIGRYQDARNLYYAGIRVDGTAVIKKKANGVYKTLIQEPIFIGDEYDRNSNPSLLPKNKWFGLRMNIQNNERDGSVKIELYFDRESSGEWERVLSTEDQGQGLAPLLSAGYNGIRSDFMDIEISEFKVISL